MPFSRKEVRLLSPFMWHYRAWSPWRALGKLLGSLAVILMLVKFVPSVKKDGLAHVPVAQGTNSVKPKKIYSAVGLPFLPSEIDKDR